MNFSRAILALLLTILYSDLSFGDLPALKKSSVVFLENKGQWQQEILYRGNAGDAHVSFLRDGLSFAQFTGSKSAEGYPVYQVWNLRYHGVNGDAAVKGNSGVASVNSYISGNDPSKWVIRPSQYNELWYGNFYDRIDLVWYGHERDLKYDFIVHPGGKIQDIRAGYEGVSGLKINEQGELEVRTPAFTQVQKNPVAWQVIHGVKKLVSVKYELIDDSTFGFMATEYFNPDYDLVIDPLFEMVWASYTQATGISNNINYCFGNAMDGDGNVYLTGMVDSTFPITPGAYSGPGNVQPEIFVAKFSTDGTTMLYSTYLPGNSSEHGIAIAVDDLGRAFVTGVVDLNITGIQTFPSTPNAYQPVHDDGSDAFLTVLTPDGTNLVYSTFLGGDGGEGGYGIVLGDPGIAYITGSTSGGTFPVVASAAFPQGTNDVYVCKFDINQSGSSSLIYSVRIGAGQFNYAQGRAIALNSAGNVFVTGTLGLGFGSMLFPTTPGVYSNVYTPGQDNAMSFVLKLSNTLPVTLEYSTYLVPGNANAIDVDDVTGEAYIVGSTFTFAFPVTPGVIQPVHGGSNLRDAFVIKLNATGSALSYATFLGGNLDDTGTGIAVNSAGEAYVTGIAQDQFPVSPGAYQPGHAGGSYDFFAVHLNATATAYACGGSTYIGGSDADYSGSFYDYPSPRISLRDHGGVNDTICISSTSHSQDFPTTPGVYGPVKVNSIADQPVFFKMTCQVIVVPPVAAFVSSINPTCTGTTVDFNDNSQNGPSSWQWYFPGGVPATSTQQDPSGILYATSGTYTVSLVACNSSGCDSISSTLIITVPTQIAVALGNDTTICNGSSVTLTAPAGFNNYTWQLNGNPVSATGNVLAANQAGQYVVQVTDTTGCTGTDTLEVSLSIPLVTLGNDLSACSGDSV